MKILRPDEFPLSKIERLLIKDNKNDVINEHVVRYYQQWDCSVLH